MMDPNEIGDQNIRELAAAICIQAAVDYKKSLMGKWGGVVGRNGIKYIYKPKKGGNIFLLRGKDGWFPATRKHIKPPEVYEDFFTSPWFEMLAGMHNTEQIIRYMRLTRREKTYNEW